MLTAAMDGPPGEIHVDIDLVQVLLAQQHPNLATLPLRACESGFDNFMFRLGESFAVRLPRSAAAARLLANEQQWLLTISDRLPLQIPVPIRVGQPGFGFPVALERGAVAGGFNRRSYAGGCARSVASRCIPARAARAGAGRRATQRGALTPLTSRDEAIAERMQHSKRSTDVITDRIREAWREALEAPGDTRPTWIHGDLHPRNVLTVDGMITGVIDWGDMTSGDPAIDLACLWMLLPDQVARETAQAYGASSSALWVRARGWAVLFGVMLLDTGLAGNVRNAAMGEQILRRI